MPLKDSAAVNAYIPKELHEELKDYRFKKKYASFSKLIGDCIKAGFEVIKKRDNNK